MTDEELAAIEARAQAAIDGQDWFHPAYGVAKEEVPKLIAEIRLLRARASESAERVARAYGTTAGEIVTKTMAGEPPPYTSPPTGMGKRRHR